MSNNYHPNVKNKMIDYLGIRNISFGNQKAILEEVLNERNQISYSVKNRIKKMMSVPSWKREQIINKLNKMNNFNKL